MNQVFAGGLALIIALILWSSKKQPKSSSFFKAKKDAFLNTEVQSSLIIDRCLQNQKSERLNNKKSTFFSNQSSINPIKTKKQLTKLISGNPNDRLLAIQIASKWGNKKAIPFLKRGLKDSDCRVVIASAAAISSFKGHTFDLKRTQASRPPRNVSLMR